MTPPLEKSNKSSSPQELPMECLEVGSPMETDLGQIEALIAQKDYSAAEEKLGEFKADYYDDPGERTGLHDCSDYQILLAKSQYYRAQILENTGRAAQAEGVYHRVQPFLQHLIDQEPKATEVLALQTRIHGKFKKLVIQRPSSEYGSGFVRSIWDEIYQLSPAKHAPEKVNNKIKDQIVDAMRKWGDLEELTNPTELLTLAKGFEWETAKASYFQGLSALFEGNYDYAHFKLREFKRTSEGTKDEVLLDFRRQVLPMLREMAVQSIDQLEAQNDALLGQRMKNPEMTFSAERAHRENARYLSGLKSILKSEGADTLDEAITAYGRRHQEQAQRYRSQKIVGDKLQVWLGYKSPAIASEDYTQEKNSERELWKDYFKVPAEPALLDPKSYPHAAYARLEGGTLKLPPRSLMDPCPELLRVVVGKRGGEILTPDQVRISFPPSSAETVVLLKGGRLVTTPTLKAGVDYREKPVSLLERAFADEEFQTLLKLHTQESLEKIQGVEGRRETLLQTAEQLRRRNGSYAVAAQFLEELLSEEIDRATRDLPWATREECQKEILDDTNKIEKQIESQLLQLKQQEPEVFAKRFPEGKPSELDRKEIFHFVFEEKFRAKVKKLALAKLDEKYKAGLMTDPVAARAWKTYESMLDPLDKIFTISDEGIDRIVDEAVIFAVTMPLAMGAGSALRGGLAGTSLFLRFAARGGVQAFASRGAIWAAGSVTEGVLQQAGNPVVVLQALHDLDGISERRLFRLGDQGKSLGWNILMSGLFHTGGRLWGNTAHAMGIGESAILAAAERGESTLGKRILFQSGNLTTQTGLATAMGEGQLWMSGEDSPHTFAERVAAHGGRMLGMHYGLKTINVATGNSLERGERLGQLKFEAAYKAFQSYHYWFRPSLDKFSGFVEEQSLQKSVEFAQSIHFDLNGEIVVPKNWDFSNLSAKAEAEKSQDFSSSSFIKEEVDVLALRAMRGDEHALATLREKAKGGPGHLYVLSRLQEIDKSDGGGAEFYKNFVDSADIESIIALAKDNPHGVVALVTLAAMKNKKAERALYSKDLNIQGLIRLAHLEPELRDAVCVLSDYGHPEAKRAEDQWFDANRYGLNGFMPIIFGSTALFGEPAANHGGGGIGLGPHELGVIAGIGFLIGGRYLVKQWYQKWQEKNSEKKLNPPPEKTKIKKPDK